MVRSHWILLSIVVLGVGGLETDVELYGAKADGKTFSGDAFNAAITSVFQGGGGEFSSPPPALSQDGALPPSLSLTHTHTCTHTHQSPSPGIVNARGGGAYIVGGVQLKSHVTLSIATNSSVIGSSDPARWTRTQADITIPTVRWTKRHARQEDGGTVHFVSPGAQPRTARRSLLGQPSNQLHHSGHGARFWTNVFPRGVPLVPTPLLRMKLPCA
jgi:hypothetical protein